MSYSYEISIINKDKVVVQCDRNYYVELFKNENYRNNNESYLMIIKKDGNIGSSDRKIRHIFKPTDDIYYINQCMIDDLAHFMVCGRFDDNKNITFRHYIDGFDFHCVFENECFYGNFNEKNRIDDETYIISQNKNKININQPNNLSNYYIYRLRDNEMSPAFTNIYKSKDSNSDIVYVEREIPGPNKLVCDNIIYGIDPHTFYLETKIYSEIQDRYLCYDNNMPFGGVSFNKTEEFINKEIYKYVKLLDEREKMGLDNNYEEKGFQKMLSSKIIDKLN